MTTGFNVQSAVEQFMVAMQPDQVGTFHLDNLGRSADPELRARTQRLRDLRLRLIDEECYEITEAVGLDLVQLAKELADLVYVTYGFAVSAGIPLDEVVAAVHNSNMSKLGADGKPLIRADGKVLKGPDYIPAEPAIKEILRQVGKA